MRIFYVDTAGNMHLFPLKDETLNDILNEFDGVGGYLKSIGVSFRICGTTK